MVIVSRDDTDLRICYGISLSLRKYGFVNHVTECPVLEYGNFPGIVWRHLLDKSNNLHISH